MPWNLSVFAKIEQTEQWSEYVTFWRWSRWSSDPYLGLTDTDPDADADPVLFVSDLEDANKKYFMLIPFWRYRYITTFTLLFKDNKS